MACKTSLQTASRRCASWYESYPREMYFYRSVKSQIQIHAAEYAASLRPKHHSIQALSFLVSAPGQLEYNFGRFPKFGRSEDFRRFRKISEDILRIFQPRHFEIWFSRRKKLGAMIILHIGKIFWPVLSRPRRSENVTSEDFQRFRKISDDFGRHSPSSSAQAFWDMKYSLKTIWELW